MAISKIGTVLAAISLVTAGSGCAASSQVRVTNEVVQNAKVKTVNTINTPAISATPATDVSFECKITKADNAINVNYSVTNKSDGDIYVLDAYPFVDENRKALADLKGFYLSLREPSTALVLKGVPPPPDRPVAVRVMPLGTKLEPKASVSRELRIPLPLRERSDWYYPPLPPEEYDVKSVDKMVVLVQFVRAKSPQFTAVPAHYAPEFFVVNATDLVKRVETLRKEFDIEKSQMFVRRDRFSRLEE